MSHITEGLYIPSDSLRRRLTHWGNFDIIKGLGLWSHAWKFPWPNDLLINGVKNTQWRQRSCKVSAAVFWQRCYCFWDFDPLPRSSHGLHHNETQLDISNSVRSTPEEGNFWARLCSEGRSKRVSMGFAEQVSAQDYLPWYFCTCPPWTWEEHLLGIRETTYGVVVQNKRSRKSWCCSLQVITRPQLFEPNLRKQRSFQE